MIDTIRAAQLVYSNVEAEHSPTRRRGFQVWLCSPRLKDQQREIARRLEDFEWPAADAAANHLTERFTFFRSSVGDFVIARTVPLAERDALGRAGRFHAHALAIPSEEFAKIGNDPFRVLEHFPFQCDPITAIASGAWQSGVLPEEPIWVGLAVPDDSALTASVRKALPLLARWLDGPDDPRPLALAVPPDRLAHFLRAVFRVLPPSLRAKATFDTLSTGQALNTLPYRFAGGHDPATVRDWPYRRAYRLDLDAGDFATPPTPPAHPALERLAATWAADAALTDDDRESSYQLLKAIRGTAATLVPTEVSTKAIELVGAAGDNAGFAQQIRDRLAADLLFPSLIPLAEGAARKWIGPFTRDALARLTTPIPPELLADWLLDHVDATAITPTVGADLERWASLQLANSEASVIHEVAAKLYLIGLRTQPSVTTRLTELRGQPGWAKFLDEWFRDWFLSRSALRDPLATDAARAKLADEVFQNSARLSPQVLTDLECYLAITGVAAGEKALAVAVAFRRGQAGRMANLLSDRSDLTLARWVVLRAELAGITFSLGLGNLDEQSPGVILAPNPHLDRTLAEALFEALAEHFHTRLVLYERAIELAERLAPRTVVQPALGVVNAAYERGDWKSVESEMNQLGAMEFRAFLADRLHDKSRISAIGAALGDGASLWVGPVIESNNANPELFAKFYSRVMRVIRSNPYRTPERVAALLTALRVRTGAT